MQIGQRFLAWHILALEDELILVIHLQPLA
jgi:hypothetical protein